MKIIERQKRDLELAKYLCVVIGKRTNGNPLYRTIEETADKFNLAPSHVAKIKAKLIGKDIDGERKIKEEYLL